MQNIAALADKLNLPQFPSILRRYLHFQLHPTDPRDPDDIPLDECPLYDGTLRVYNSACATFFAPSDLSGVYGMRCEHICSCPMWRSEGPCFDCAFVVTDPQAEGMCSLDIARILCFFSVKYLGTFYPCAVVHWFDHVGVLNINYCCGLFTDYISARAHYHRVHSTIVPSVACQTTEGKYHSY